MNETKKISTPKTCPLLGSHVIPSGFQHSKLTAISLQSLDFSILNCNGKDCQWWSETEYNCTAIIFTRAAEDLNHNLIKLGNTLGRIADLLYDKGGKKHGDS